MSVIHPGPEAVGRHMRVHGLWSFLAHGSVPEVGSYVLPLPSSLYHDSVFFWDISSPLQEIVPILDPEADMGFRHSKSEHRISLAMVIGSGIGIRCEPCQQVLCGSDSIFQERAVEEEGKLEQQQPCCYCEA